MDKRNLLVISNELEDFKSFLDFNDNEFQIISTTLINLPEALSELNKNQGDILRENFVIVINIEIFNKEINEKIKSISKSKLNIQKPHLLFISKENKITPENFDLDMEHNFYYPLLAKNKKECEKITIYYYVKMIFQRTTDISRLDNYIVNAFRTIVDAEIITRQKQEIEKLYHELDEMSKHDYLTKVLNRKAFFEAMEREISRSVRKHKEMEKTCVKYDNSFFIFSCVMMDIDHFKVINDTHGHIIGDIVLKELGALLRSKKYFREPDIIGRYGGEEFVIILTDTKSIEAKAPVERLRNHIKKLKFIGKNNKKFNITISIGISQFKMTDKTYEEVISRADEAMYYAKKNGRDQTIVYETNFRNN